MNIVDIGIIFIVLLMGLLGLKRGAFKTIIYLITMLIISIVSYEFKDYIAGLLMKILPFIKFGGDFEGIAVVNVLFYKGIAFLLVFCLLVCILSILLKISGLLDLLVKITIILEIPSKIIGMILGLIEGLIICYVGLFFLIQLPIADNPIYGSKFANPILEKTPILNKIFSDGYELNKNIYTIIDEKIENYTSDEINEEVLDELKKNGTISEEDLNSLKEKSKEIINDVIDKVKEKEND